MLSRDDESEEGEDEEEESDQFKSYVAPAKKQPAGTVKVHIDFPDAKFN